MVPSLAPALASPGPVAQGLPALQWYDSRHDWDRLPGTSMPTLLRAAECLAGRGGGGQAGARAGHCWQVGWEPMEA